MATSVSLAANVFLTEREVREWVFARETPPDLVDTDEDVLYRLTNAVCSAIERATQKYFIIQALTEYYDGGKELVFLSHYPVSEITSITEGESTVVPVADYGHYPETGILYRKVGAWYSGRRMVKVVYKAGFGTQTVVGGKITAIVGVPEDARQAALTWIRAIWKSEPENFSAQVAGGIVIRPEAMPAEVAGLLRNYVGNCSY